MNVALQAIERKAYYGKKNFEKPKKGKNNTGKMKKSVEGGGERKKKKPKPNIVVRSCVCLMMSIKSIFKNIDLEKNEGTCAVCGCQIDDMIDAFSISHHARTFDLPPSIQSMQENEG